MTPTPALRWLAALALTGAVAAVPLVPRLLPAEAADLTPAELLVEVQAADAPYEALVDTAGTLQLPVAARFDSVGSLLGEQQRLRVWWSDAERWRVDQLLVAGESDLHHERGTTTDYSYEDAAAKVSLDPDIRLPRTSDLLPASLAHRFLDDATPAQVTALTADRVAGVSAAGLRLSAGSGAPDGAAESTIDHVDVWADPATGLALRVEVWAVGDRAASFTSEAVQFDAVEPAASTVAFRRTSTTASERVDVLDIADAANQYAPLRPPQVVAGLEARESSRGAVGVYGTGLTQLIAIPLRDSEAVPLREQISITPGSQVLTNGSAVQQGPLGVAVGGLAGDGGWLVAGTLSLDALDQALADLQSGTVFVEPGRG